jgi:nicotinamidase-related amidase
MIVIFSRSRSMAIKATPTPAKKMLTPQDHTLLLVDLESMMAFSEKSVDPIVLRNNAGLVAKTGAGFKVPTILTTVAQKTFSGPMFEEVTSQFPGLTIIDRTTMNAWEDKRVNDRVNAIGKGRIVIAGLWTSVCVAGPTLSALDQGFEVFVITDACGDVSTEAHERAVDRMVAAGAQPITSVQYLLELQRDWTRTETYELTLDIARQLRGPRPRRHLRQGHGRKGTQRLIAARRFVPQEGALIMEANE